MRKALALSKFGDHFRTRIGEEAIMWKHVINDGEIIGYTLITPTDMIGVLADGKRYPNCTDSRDIVEKL